MYIPFFIVKIFLKSVIEKYFSSLSLKGYKLDIKDSNNNYIIIAEIPKNNINDLYNKMKGGK